MTAATPGGTWVADSDWSRIASLLGLSSGAAPGQVVAALERRRGAQNAGRVVGERRAAAVRACRRCDPQGWELGADRLPIEPAVRCNHESVALQPIRDITQPLHPKEN